MSLRRRGVPTFLDHGRVPRDVTAGALREMRALARVCSVYLPSREELLSLWEEISGSGPGTTPGSGPLAG